MAEARAAASNAQAGTRQTTAQQAENASTTLVATAVIEAVTVNVNSGVQVVSVRAQAEGGGVGPLIMWPAVRPEVTATAATGNGARIRLRIGCNIVAALQRKEVIGRSWRGSLEGG